MAYTIDFQNLTQIQSQQQSFMEEAEKEDMRKLLSTLTEGLESQLDPGFFQGDNDIQKNNKQKQKATKTTTKYSNTKVKTRNLLTNVSYRRYKPEDVEKTNFVIDIFSFLATNLNPTGLDRKLETLLERDYLQMVWDTCVPHKFIKLISLKDNFIELSKPHITYQKANNIVVKFVEEDVQNIDLLKSALRNHLRTIQYVYSLLFSKIYNRTNRSGINTKSHFGFIFNNWKHHKNNIVLPKPTKNRVVEQPTKKK